MEQTVPEAIASKTPHVPQKESDQVKSSADDQNIQQAKAVEEDRTKIKLGNVRDRLRNLFSFKRSVQSETKPINGDTDEKSAQNPLHNIRLTRRRGLQASAAATAHGILPSVNFLENPLEKKAPELSWKEEQTNEQLDLAHVGALLEKLSQETGDPESRKKAITQSLRQLVYPFEKPKPGQSTLPSADDAGSAFMIDESGIYVGAAHSAVNVDNDRPGYTLRDTPIAVLNPETGELNPVKSLIFDKEHDVAIFFSPTGKERKPVDNLQISFDWPKKGDKLSVSGISNQNRPYEVNSIDTETGEVLQERVNTGYFADAIFVKGMIPPPGTSGGPVYNEDDGKVVALCSGVNTQSIRGSDFNLGRVTSLVHIKNMGNQSIYTFDAEHPQEGKPWVIDKS